MLHSLTEARLPPLDRYQLRMLSELYGLAHNLAGHNAAHGYAWLLTEQEKGYSEVLLNRIQGVDGKRRVAW